MSYEQGNINGRKRLGPTARYCKITESPCRVGPIIRLRGQQTHRLHDLCLDVLTVHNNELRLFWAKTLPILLIIYVPDIAAV